MCRIYDGLGEYIYIHVHPGRPGLAARRGSLAEEEELDINAIAPSRLGIRYNINKPSAASFFTHPVIYCREPARASMFRKSFLFCLTAWQIGGETCS